MQRINRIAAFASVSFVLFFIAKINKVDLYTAYFKTIVDVEVRNSQDVLLSGVYLDTDFSLELQSAQVLPEMGGSGLALVTSTDVPRYRPKTITSHCLGNDFHKDRFHFFAAAAPRAPTT